MGDAAATPTHATARASPGAASRARVWAPTSLRERSSMMEITEESR